MFHLARAASHVTVPQCVQVVTDVEGSTQLWEWDAEVMGEAVELHNSVLRGVMEEHGGHEVGISFMHGQMMHQLDLHAHQCAHTLGGMGLKCMQAQCYGMTE
jgi:class 3 adenylate cyclase